MTFSVTNKQLYRVGSCPLESAVEEVKKLAESVWYKGYQPTWRELETLRSAMTDKEFQRSLCVLEMLSQYPVCRRDTALHLQQMTRRFHQQLLGGDDAPTLGRYSPAKRWGLTDATTSLRKALLPLQTRTYADSTGYRHGLSA
ncbi:hypothetical protein HVA01_33440 [Halovibrio variabilis]|uniref:Uncharacterized protein n=1 Tax=Halovibrio variabilis TaxID=31910 RepID=A0A511UVD4_9GAMM|nr:hypothetical protein [Halovibrio variabilis]GEN29698.1 hypothetical protein HVA01_33440 [Halovibrio variabilis]